MTPSSDGAGPALTHKFMTEKTKKTKNKTRETVEAILTALLVALVIRWFVIEPYRIPSSSMEPTLLVGDFVLVNKFAYGMRFPMTKKWLYEGGDPKKGDVIVFIYPKNEKEDYIKRVVGVPGDKVEIKEGEVFINGEAITNVDLNIDGIDPKNTKKLLVSQNQKKPVPDVFKDLYVYDGFEQYQIKIEQLGEKLHLIQRSKVFPREMDLTMVVPERSFFVMGDNRDNSQDSRFWGFVPRENLKGKAILTGFSIDKPWWKFPIRWTRIFKKIT